MNVSRPTRATTAGRAYLDLQNLARQLGRPTDELHQLYALESFLTRLATSTHADQLILKGGVLLAAYDARHPTRDIDLHAQQLPGDVDDILHLVRTVADLAADDGLLFDAAQATAEVIRHDDPYAGVRVTLDAELATARLRFHIDVNLGDPVQPPPQSIQLPRLLHGHIKLLGYPLPMVLAEKIVTAVQRGTANTRWRDYADLHLLSDRHDVDGEQLSTAVTTVASYRGAVLTPLRDLLADYAPAAQPRWAAWRPSATVG
ncbi:MAG: nucleotidyl transferase AbiEii/AbiGii toxin family protein [Pseudonocardiaceae bacterium]